MATTCTCRVSFTSEPVAVVRADTVKVNGVIKPCMPAYGLGGRMVELLASGLPKASGTNVIW